MIQLYATYYLKMLKNVLVCLSAKLGLPKYGKKKDWVRLKMGCWGEYLDLRMRK